MHFGSRDSDNTGGIINDQVSVGKDRTFFITAGNILHPAHGCADAGQELLDGEWLGQVIVGAAVKGKDLVAVLSAGADDDNDGGRPGTDGADDLNAVNIRKAQVQQDQAGMVRCAQRNCFVSGRGCNVGVVIDLECRCDQVQDGTVVFHNKDFHVIHFKEPP